MPAVVQRDQLFVCRSDAIVGKLRGVRVDVGIEGAVHDQARTLHLGQDTRDLIDELDQLVGRCSGVGIVHPQPRRHLWIDREALAPLGELAKHVLEHRHQPGAGVGELDRRRIGDRPGQFGMMGRKVQGKQRTEGQAAHKDLVAVGFQVCQGPFHAIDPVLPTVPVCVRDGGTVTGQTRCRNGIPTAMCIVAHQAHLWRRAGEPVDQQQPNRAALQGKWARFQV